MKKVLCTLTSILFLLSIVGCGSSKKNEIEKEPVLNEASSSEVEEQIQIVKRGDIEALYNGKNTICYVVEENQDIVSGDILIKDGHFNGDLVILSDIENNRIISLYINNKQVKFKIDGNEGITHNLNLVQGKNEFKIQISDSIEIGTNDVLLLSSSGAISNSQFTTLQETRLNLINNSNSKNSSILYEPNEIYQYEILGDNSESSSYFNLSKENYLSKNLNNINNNIKVNPGEEVEIPVILTSKSVTSDAIAKVIINGVQKSEGKISIFEDNKEVYIPIQLSAPTEEGKYIVNIVIINRHDFGAMITASQEIQIEVVK